MAEYKSFHYLMHQVPDSVKPVYVTGPTPLSFMELYSPRTDLILIHKSEKSYWRTRDRIEYCLYEDRKNKTMVITCRNLDNVEVYRTIFLDLEVLYYEIECKIQGNRDKLIRKKDKKLNTDELLHKAAADFVLARLNINSELLSWPDFSIQSAVDQTISTEKTTETSQPVHIAADTIVDNITTATIETATSGTGTIILPPTDTIPTERMCTFNKLASDVYEKLEINKPEAIKLDSIEYVKLQPTTVSTLTATTTDSATTTNNITVTAVSTSTTTTAVSSNAVPTVTSAALSPVSTTTTTTTTAASTSVTTTATKTTTTTKPSTIATFGVVTEVGTNRKKPSAKHANKSGTISIKNNKVLPV